MADHFTLRERQHRTSQGYDIEWELWGGLDLRDPRAGHATGDLIEIYGDDERDAAHAERDELNELLSTDLWDWLRGWTRCPNLCHHGIAASYAAKFQGGLSNDELLSALQAKLPGVQCTDRDLTMFALGVEVGARGVRVGAPSVPPSEPT